MQHSAKEILKKYWGYDQFRPLQLEIISSIVTGKDTLALLPTGGGKSICFQVPILMKPGVGIVISPLIALMRDQVDQLKKRNIKAEAIFSGMKASDIDRILDNVIYGDIKFLYVSPERIQTELFRERLKKMNVNVIAVDEAHCISQWGYDFRPNYLKISSLRELKPEIPVLALTATATPLVVEDIMLQLNFNEKNVFRKSFVRENLSYSVKEVSDKISQSVSVLNKIPGTSVIYCKSRMRVQKTSDLLKQKGIEADYYHAGLTAEVREQKQRDWINNKIRAMVCTNAFGMGIDKPDVRTVIHIDSSDSLEAYFQEAGRAGRDEKKAWAVLWLQEADLIELNRKKNEDFPELEEIKKIYESICMLSKIALGEMSEEFMDIDISILVNSLKINPGKLTTAIRFLAQANVLEFEESNQKTSTVYSNSNSRNMFIFIENNPEYEVLLKNILRMCSGIFDYHVSIKEAEIAKLCELNILDLKKQLMALEKYKLLEYKEASQTSVFRLCFPRVPASNLPLNVEFWKSRKKNFTDKLEAVIGYLKNKNICRTRYLISYFGEKNDKDCGICDICVEKRKTALMTDEFYFIKKTIEKELKIKTLTIDELSNKCNFPNEKFRNVLDSMIEIGEVEIKSNGILVLA